MNIFIYSVSIFIIICFILIAFAVIYNKYQNYIIRINEVDSNIDSVLRKRFDLLNKSISIIKANSEEKEVLEMIVKLRSRKLSNFELDRALYDAINEFNIYKEKYPDLGNSESFIKIELGLNESEIDITALRKYYNDIITDYNKLVRTLPSNLIGKVFKYKEKTYFDGKNQNDNIVNDFKL